MKRKNVKNCRNLRINQTDTERKLWSILRNRQLAGVKFRRQFSAGNYILDFYSPEHKLAIEADGGQHYGDIGRKKDEIRAKEISKSGIEIIRFSDVDILNNIEGVCMVIQNVIEKKITPHLCPLPGGERNDLKSQILAGERKGNLKTLSPLGRGEGEGELKKEAE